MLFVKLRHFCLQWQEAVIRGSVMEFIKLDFLGIHLLEYSDPQLALLGLDLSNDELLHDVSGDVRMTLILKSLCGISPGIFNQNGIPTRMIVEPLRDIVNNIVDDDVWLIFCCQDLLAINCYALPCMC